MVNGNGAQRALLLGVVRNSSGEDSLDELELLANTAGVTVVDKIIQKRSGIDPLYYVGQGKAEEIARAAKSLDIDMFICDDELSPVQIKKLERTADCQIIDRAMLILDIFAQRAKSLEGKIQVELAQLQYLMPRLTGKGIEMSQEGGGIGTRGPGETKLETDRRHIRRRLHKLKQDLRQVQKNRQLITSSRHLPVISLVGYTGAGKSALMNALTSAEVTTGERLFDTLDTTTRGLDLSDGRTVLLSDTVGFVNKLPHHLIEAFKSTLEEVKAADLLLHVVDGTSPRMEEEVSVVNNVLTELGVSQKPTLLVINKMDMAQEESIDDILFRQNPTVRISAVNGTNLDLLLREITRLLPTTRRVATLLIPFDDGQALDEIHQRGRILDEDFTPNGTKIKGDIELAALNKLSKYLLDEQTSEVLTLKE